MKVYTHLQVMQIVEQFAAISVAGEHVFQVRTEEKPYAVHIILETEHMISAMHFPIQEEQETVNLPLLQEDAEEDNYDWVDDWVEQEQNAYQAWMEEPPPPKPKLYPHLDVLDADDTLSLDRILELGLDISDESQEQDLNIGDEKASD